MDINGLNHGLNLQKGLDTFACQMACLVFILIHTGSQLPFSLLEKAEAFYGFLFCWKCLGQGKWSAWSRRPRRTSKRTSKRQVQSFPHPAQIMRQGVSPQRLTSPSSSGSGFKLFSPLSASFLQRSCELILRCRAEFLTLQLGSFDGKCPQWIVNCKCDYVDQLYSRIHSRPGH